MPNYFRERVMVSKLNLTHVKVNLLRRSVNTRFQYSVDVVFAVAIKVLLYCVPCVFSLLSSSECCVLWVMSALDHLFFLMRLSSFCAFSFWGTRNTAHHRASWLIPIGFTFSVLFKIFVTTTLISKKLPDIQDMGRLLASPSCFHLS